MNWKWFIILFLTALLLSIGLGIFYPVSASIELHQGDVCYLGERVDLSRTIAWPDYKLAWCAGDEYGCTPPTQIITISGYMYNYYLDPAVWHVGTYYRWSGEWNEGENMEAFTILPGTRPIAINETANQTPEAEPTPEPIIEGPYAFLIARGDNPTLFFTSARTDSAHLWMFGTTKQVIDVPMQKKGNDYIYQMNITDTFSTDAGTYDGYLQFSGVNGMQDVYWNPTSQCIETPYRTSLQKDVCPNVWNPANVKMEFANMVKTAYNCDDVLVPVKIQVKEPEVVITDLVRGTDTIWMQGKTTWSPGTELTLALDPDNYATTQDKALHTWRTTITGTMDKWRIFTVSCELDLDELAVGNHEFKMSVTKNKYVTDAWYTFRVSDTFVMPTPTPKVEKVLIDAAGNKIVMTTTVVPTPTPINWTPTPARTYNTTTKTNVVEYVNGTLMNTTNVTGVKATPVPTTVAVSKPKATPTPTVDPNIHVPIPIWIPIVAVGLGLLWRKK